MNLVDIQEKVDVWTLHSTYFFSHFFIILLFSFVFNVTPFIEQMLFSLPVDMME